MNEHYELLIQEDINAEEADLIQDERLLDTGLFLLCLNIIFIFICNIFFELDLQKRLKTRKEREREIQTEVLEMSALTFQDICGKIN